MNVIC